MSQSLFAASKVVAEPLVINEVGKNAQVVTSLFLSFVVGISEMVIDILVGTSNSLSCRTVIINH